MENTNLASNWVGSWSVSPNDFSSCPISCNHRTIRAKLRLSLGGIALRLKFSNRFGVKPVHLSEVNIALPGKDCTLAKDTSRQVTFNGRPAVTLQPYQEMLISDEVDLAMADLGEVSISFFIPGEAELQTAYFGSSASYTSHPGNYCSSAFFPVDTSNKNRSGEEALPLLFGVDVRTAEPSASVVAFGDSITAADWPDCFAEILMKKSIKLGVLRQGIGGNKVLTDSPEHFTFGDAGITRFPLDVFHQSGAKYVIVLHGVNDIIHSTGPAPLSLPVEAEEIIDGLKSYIRLAHERGLKIFAATIMPFEGYKGGTAMEEEKRLAVNHWIRTSGEFDGILDFDKATQDPLHPSRLLPEYDSGDHLHPSRKGGEAMAASIDLRLFQQPTLFIK